MGDFAPSPILTPTSLSPHPTPFETPPSSVTASPPHSETAEVTQVDEIELDDVETLNKFATDAARPPLSQILCEIDCEFLPVTEDNVTRLQRGGCRAYNDILVLEPPTSTPEITPLIQTKRKFHISMIWTSVCLFIARIIVSLFLPLIKLVRKARIEKAEREETRHAEALSSPPPSTGVRRRIRQEETIIRQSTSLKVIDYGLKAVLPTRWYKSLIDCEPLPPNTAVVAFTWHTNKEIFSIALNDDTVHLYNLKSNEWMPLILKHPAQVGISAIAWQPYSSGTIAVASRNGICLWRIVESKSAKEKDDTPTSGPDLSSSVPVLRSYQPGRAGRVGLEMTPHKERIDSFKGRRTLPFAPQSPVARPPVTPWDKNLARTSSIGTSQYPAISDRRSSGMSSISGLNVSCGSGAHVTPPKFVTAGFHAAYLTLLDHDAVDSGEEFAGTVKSECLSQAISDCFSESLGIEAPVHDAQTVILTWSPIGRWLASGCCDRGELVIWDATTGDKTVLKRRGDGISVLKWSPNGQYLFAGTTGRRARIYLCSDWSWETWGNFGDGCQDAVWGSDSRTLLIAPRQDGLIHALRLDGTLNSSSISARLISTEDVRQCVAWSDTGQQHIVGGHVKCMDWDASSNRLVVTFKGHHQGSELIAVFATHLDVVFEMLLLGFIRGPDNCSDCMSVAFRPTTTNPSTLLASLWRQDGGTSSRLCFTPMCFER